MGDERVTMTEAESSRLDFIGEHLATYLDSGGARGHVMSFTAIGGLPFTTTLLLETFGRKSGERRLSPLIYGVHGGEVVVIASKGGADVHPGWYFNLPAGKEVTIQIATEAFRATWRVADETERDAIWNYMAGLFPPYRSYRTATDRVIPVVLLQPGEAVEPLKPR